MKRQTPSQLPATSTSAGVAAPAVVIAIASVAVVVAVAAAAFGVIGAPPAPSPTASPAPSAPVASPSKAPVSPDPTPVPLPTPTPKPSVPVVTPGPGGVDGVHIPLNVFGDADVTLDVSDRDGLLVDVASGDAKDGMSVRWGTAQLRNLGANVVEVTWVGLPGDEGVTLVVKPQGDGVLLRFGQNAPPADSDAMGADRVIVLTFAQPVDASALEVDFTTADD